MLMSLVSVIIIDSQKLNKGTENNIIDHLEDDSIAKNDEWNNMYWETEPHVGLQFCVCLCFRDVWFSNK